MQQATAQKTDERVFQARGLGLPDDATWAEIALAARQADKSAFFDFEDWRNSMLVRGYQIE